MKSAVLFVVLAALVSLGSAIMAEPIMRDSDSCPVSVEIAQWVWVEFYDLPVGFDVDYEAAEPMAQDTEAFRCGHNCDVRLTGSLVPPPGAPGIWTWRFRGDGQSRSLYLDGPVSYPDVTHGPGVYYGEVTITVNGITILDPAGIYGGGVMTINVEAL
jgi:hypothetical protein